jgi:hypothetical protein
MSTTAQDSLISDWADWAEHAINKAQKCIAHGIASPRALGSSLGLHVDHWHSITCQLALHVAASQAPRKSEPAACHSESSPPRERTPESLRH